MRRTLVLFATQLLLWTIVTQLNDALSGQRIYVFAGALFVAFSALTQPLRPGLVATMFGALVCDANSPVTFGTHLLLFSTAHLTLFQIRERVPRDDNIAAVVVVLFTNLALFLVFSFSQIHVSPAPAAVWPRLIADLVCSQVLLALVTPWFLALQAGSLALAQVPREDHP